MQIETQEHVAITNGLHAQIGVMTRLAKERRGTIEALKQELQLRDRILKEATELFEKERAALLGDLSFNDQELLRFVRIIEGTEAPRPDELDLPWISAFVRAQKAIAKLNNCRGCKKRGTCCK